MKKILFGAAVLGMFAVASVASAAGVGQSLQAFATLAGEDNVGGFISGEIYGNTSNPSGNGNGVLPSLSPGPWKCGGADCAQPTDAGSSMGDLISPLTSQGNSNSDFANSKDPGPDFSDN